MKWVLSFILLPKYLHLFHKNEYLVSLYRYSIATQNNANFPPPTVTLWCMGHKYITETNMSVSFNNYWVKVIQKKPFSPFSELCIIIK